MEPDAVKSAPVAIIGMSCRLPGNVMSPADYWQFLRNGRSGLARFTQEELRVAGEASAEYGRSNYVNVGAALTDIDQFDLTFFGFDRQDLDVMDPQHRLLLQGVWEALEDAGYGSPRNRGEVGLFAGCGVNTYYLEQVVKNAAYERPEDVTRTYGEVISNEKDYLVSKVAYLLNLRGPAVDIQTACSTSLVAAHYAVQSLRLGECELAVAGGATVKVPHGVGYRYYADGLRSLSGECRVFDEHADGAVLGNGVGLVVLKLLRNAVRDRDHIYAVIRGSAVNNDGDNKVSFQAPAVSGQEQVIVSALQNATIDPRTIHYLEAHGTGTKLGDPIEVAAATKAFNRWTKKTQFCAIGSVKSNIGHAEAAAGVAGLMKASLALYHGEIPPTLNVTTPSPALSLASSPFYVNTTLRTWPDETPRRAAVSSFGVGGTNAHMVLEEGPRIDAATYGRRHYVLPISAKTAHGLRASEERLADYLEGQPDVDLADVAYTLAVGREAFSHRSVIVARDTRDGIARLRRHDDSHAWREYQPLRNLPVVFLLPAEGIELTRADRALYESEPRYREYVDECLGVANGRVNATALGDSIRLFSMAYALGRMWTAYGVRPKRLLGYGVGEYAAACLRGAMTVTQAIGMLAERAEVPFKPAKTPLAESIASILDEQRVVFLEIGPGSTLLAQVRRLPSVSDGMCIPSLSDGPDGQIRDDSIDSALARLWLAGVDVDWERFYDDTGCRRTPLPTYPFDKQRYWVDKPAPLPRQATETPRSRSPVNVSDSDEAYLYLPLWKRLPFIQGTPVAAPGICLLFDDGSALGQALKSALAAVNVTAVIVTAGQAFARTGRHAYVIDPDNERHYHRLLQELVEGALTPRMMLHLWGVAERIPDDDQSEPSSFWSVYCLVKAWTRLKISSALHAGVLSSRVENVSGTETIVPENSLVLGACQAIRHELPQSRCKHFDLSLGADPSSSMLSAVGAAIVGEVLSDHDMTRVAYRDVNRWVLDLEPVQLPDADAHRLPIKERGVYWITGGTGGIGLEIAHLLTERARTTVMLIQRTAFPERQEWASLSRQGESDGVRRAIERIARMESTGSTIIVERADVTDADAMRALYEKTMKEHGGLNGVIHAAGVPGGGLLAVKSREDVRGVLAPKVAGTKAIQAALSSHPDLDFFVLCSSVTALAGAAGRSDYGAANAFLDAFSSECRRRGQGGVVSINWDAWKETGMAAAHRKREVADDSTTIFKTTFSESTHWMVREHRIYGVPTVPGVTYIEMMAAALCSDETPLEIRGLDFRHPLALTAGEVQAVMEVRRRDVGHRVRIFSADPLLPGKTILHAEATAVLAPEAVSGTIDLRSLMQRLPMTALDASTGARGDRATDEPLQLGPAWQVRLESCRAGEEELLVGLTLPDSVAEPNDEGHLHISLFDVATSYALRYLSQGELYLPLGYEKLCIYRKMPRRIYSYVRQRTVGRTAPEIMKFDVSICDVEGNEIVTVSNFAVKKAGDRAAYERSIASTFEMDQQFATLGGEPYGLSTRSALRAFSRVIAERGISQVVVSAAPWTHAVTPEEHPADASSLPALADEVAQPRVRPNLSTQYAAPSDDAERRISQIWQTMLGIDLVGVNDDYTELGGDSLIASHLVDAIAAEFNVDLSIVSLYETLTVRGLAQLVRDSLSTAPEVHDTARDVARDTTTTGQNA